jgi:hypothetical protein
MAYAQSSHETRPFIKDINITEHPVRSNEAEEGEPEDVEDEQEPEGDDLIDSEVSYQTIAYFFMKLSLQ